MGDLSLLLPFDTDDPQFTRGFELGHVWTILRTSDDRGPFTVHWSNAEMFIRIGESLGLRAVATQHGDETWCDVEFEDEVAE